MISYAAPLNAIQEINAIDNKTKRCHKKQRKESVLTERLGINFTKNLHLNRP